MTKDEAAVINGFAGYDELALLVAKVEFDAHGMMMTFKRWRNYDGSKDGLLALIARQAEEALRLSAKGATAQHG